MNCITYTIQRRLLDVGDERFKFLLLDCPRGGRRSSCSRTCAGTSCSAAGVWTEDHRIIISWQCGDPENLSESEVRTLSSTLNGYRCGDRDAMILINPYMLVV